jgi:hypothetical protein
MMTPEREEDMAHSTIPTDHTPDEPEYVGRITVQDEDREDYGVDVRVFTLPGLIRIDTTEEVGGSMEQTTVDATPDKATEFIQLVTEARDRVDPPRDHRMTSANFAPFPIP